MKKHMKAMVVERKVAIESGADGSDLFSSLVKANSLETGENGERGLTEEELIGNVFVFLFAGHGTPAKLRLFCHMPHACMHFRDHRPCPGRDIGVPVSLS